MATMACPLCLFTSDENPTDGILGNPEKITENSRDCKPGEKKHKQFGKQSCLAKLDDTFVYMILLFM